MSRIGDKSLGLEKKIHKAALLETVTVLNDVADGKKKRKSREDTSVAEVREKKNKKDTRKKTDSQGIRPSKQKRNAARKNGEITKKKVEEKTNEDKDSTECLKKMTRKERRLEKLRSKGKGLPSKEYFEKFIKKYKDDSPQEKATRGVLPSKRKEDFPKGDGNKRKKGSFSKKRKGRDQ
ncbi:uncharacterized protein Eint_090850 [Encephalitozoon intestinalis ATCC 50506]|uniref:Uncharacterized protein n=1 Tax=Encephalitozoon intestinalis (strain ATCC 50506) TaxID=876142 RepID=E0S8U8_ENCIT|nr:uncharacterized protein Eint_090850 [Encephalitozoon intestinalis ATCC 50506]ADM12214.1 hypothetical protein Eint_090850 [Encephalitozoon intestinalis ATCC 50506]UTX46022.1 hypothetical protein GPK93_09g16080 [Encephalitozoon intestinalis]